MQIRDQKIPGEVLTDAKLLTEIVEEPVKLPSDLGGTSGFDSGFWSHYVFCA
jgi:hypothetical protein